MKLGPHGVLFFRSRLSIWLAVTRRQLSAAVTQPILSSQRLAYLHSLLQTPGLLSLTVICDRPLVLESMDASTMKHGFVTFASVAAQRGSKAAQKDLKIAVSSPKRDVKGDAASAAAVDEEAVEGLIKSDVKRDRGVRLSREWRQSAEALLQWTDLTNTLAQWYCAGVRYEVGSAAVGERLRSLAVIAPSEWYTCISTITDTRSAAMFTQVLVGPTTGKGGMFQLPLQGAAARFSFEHKPVVAWIEGAAQLVPTASGRLTKLNGDGPVVKRGHGLAQAVVLTSSTRVAHAVPVLRSGQPVLQDVPLAGTLEAVLLPRGGRTATVHCLCLFGVVVTSNACVRRWHRCGNVLAPLVAAHSQRTQG